MPQLTLKQLSKDHSLIAETLDKINLRISELEESFKALKEIQDVRLSDRGMNKPAEVVVHTDAPIVSEMPIPTEYRELINKTLNQKFGIDLKYDTGLPQFSFTIIVPDEYTAMSPQEKEIKKVDLRTCVIKYAEGINGVKMWAEKVYNNFVPEVKAKILQERVYA